MKKYLIILVLLLSACTKFEPQLTAQSIYYEDVKVQLSQLMVYSRPEKPHYGPLSALFYPYHVTQTMNDGKDWGKLIGKNVWQNWTSLQIFPSMVFDERLVYRGLDDAMFTARARGFDLLVVGFVPYLYLGHTMDDSAVTLQVKIYETKRGHMVCSFEQSGRVPKRMDDDFILVKREHRMPDSAFFEIVQTIATDMAVPLTSWARYENTNKGIIAGLSAAMAEADKPQIQSYNPEQNVPSSTDKQIAPQEPNKEIAPAQTRAPVSPPKAKSINLAVQFDVDSATIKPESYPLLNELGKALISDKLKDKSVIIAGHTDSDASAEYNLDLSKKRADAVKKYLADNFPISATRIATTGFGESKPLVPNSTKYNKLLNRRVQVSITP
ncbi:OmpA family protein [Maridesulfovibrio ferrireducens]|uniref:OmpA family protein n=1 Tax=Maridesulfovibrio ferrireducens TaxID=246191 RepID=UPI001A2F228B|nr:OmpA family protein [Maridesulfovibrio ferrireducens]MBI9111026.1 OmpA family protein [Maridesulfovibrio ferrireducens]